MTKTISCDKCNGRGYFTFEQSGADYAGVTVLRCEVCQGSGMLEVPITNADHIRSMTDEEVAMHIVNTTRACGLCPAFKSCEIKYPNFSACMNVVANWLKQPYKEET